MIVSNKRTESGHFLETSRLMSFRVKLIGVKIRLLRSRSILNTKQILYFADF